MFHEKKKMFFFLPFFTSRCSIIVLTDGGDIIVKLFLMQKPTYHQFSYSKLWPLFSLNDLPEKKERVQRCTVKEL